MTVSKIPHKRRTPCCYIEAHRYLAENDEDYARAISDAVTDEQKRIASAVRKLERYEALSPLVYGVTKRGSAIERRAVLAVLGVAR